MDGNNDDSGKSNGITVDPRGKAVFWWTTVTVVACACNLLTVVIPVFEEIMLYTYHQWLFTNILCDIIYLFDIGVQMCTRYTSNGIIVLDSSKTRQHYFNSWRFILDVISVIPLDVFLIFCRHCSLFRINRCMKCYRIMDLILLEETQTRFPALLIIAQFVIACIFMFHWNACLYYWMSTRVEQNETDFWVFRFEKIFDPLILRCKILICNVTEMNQNSGSATNKSAFYAIQESRSVKIQFTNFTKKYVLSFYWSALTLTTLGEQPEPEESIENVMEILDTLLGMILFAIIMGLIGDLVVNSNIALKELRSRFDGTKRYMLQRRINNSLQKRVIDWFGFVLSQTVAFEENRMEEWFSMMPPGLRAEIKFDMHSSALLNAELLHTCENHFLQDVATRLQPRLFSPGDVLCHKGDLCKEVYIVKQGFLRTINNKNCMLMLQDGSVFGDVDVLLDIHHRRNVTVTSVGYSEVFLLTKDDFEALFEDFPEEAQRLKASALEILDNKAEKIEEVMDLGEVFSLLLNDAAMLEGTITDCFEEYKLSFRDMKQRISKLERLSAALFPGV